MESEEEIIRQVPLIQGQTLVIAGAEDSQGSTLAIPEASVQLQDICPAPSGC